MTLKGHYALCFKMRVFSVLIQDGGRPSWIFHRMQQLSCQLRYIYEIWYEYKQLQQKNGHVTKTDIGNKLRSRRPPFKIWLNGYNLVTAAHISTKFDMESKIGILETVELSDFTWDKIQDDGVCHFEFFHKNSDVSWDTCTKSDRNINRYNRKMVMWSNWHWK